ncbi:hypothetical protein FRC01_002799, partial [Tulasnella sp. 417]
MPRFSSPQMVDKAFMSAPEANGDGSVEQIKLKIKLSAASPASSSDLTDRLDGLSGWRIHPNAINFTLAKPYAYGGKAEVVKAKLKLGGRSDQQLVAIKRLRHYDDMNKRMFSNEFVHEVDVMARLSHENVIRLIGFVEDLPNGKAWFVLPWEPNGTVREFLTTGEWEIPERISL